MYENEDFIRCYDNAFSEHYCLQLINFFEWCLENNKTFDRGDDTSSLIKKDNSIQLNDLSITYNFDSISKYIRHFNTVFWDECYSLYAKDFSELLSYKRVTVNSYKIQKTLPSEGYHVWHSEHGNIDFSNRFAVWILYLNTILPEDGGETEFLYQRKRVSPKTGRLVIWPAGFSHAHRGNPPLNGVKYIMTGWVEFS